MDREESGQGRQGRCRVSLDRFATEKEDVSHSSGNQSAP